MKAKWLIQSGISLLIVLTLFVSSASACACANHQEKLETENVSCHHDSAMMAMEMESDNAAQSAVVISKDECNCIQPAYKIFAKNESLKLQKYTASVSPIPDFETETIPAVINVAKIDFNSRLYLSDSFYNSSHGRAPPRL